MGVRRGDARPRRGGPRPRHAGRVGKRLLLQRDLRARDLPDADDRRRRCCSTTGAATPWRTSPKRRARDRAARRDNREELGGQRVAGPAPRPRARGVPPQVDLEHEKRLADLLAEAVASGVVIRTAHDVSDGGLAVALAECCFTGPTPVGARDGAGRRASARRAALRRIDRVVSWWRRTHPTHFSSSRAALRARRPRWARPAATRCASAHPDTGSPWIDEPVADRSGRCGRAPSRGLESGMSATKMSKRSSPRWWRRISTTASTTSAASSASTDIPRRRTSPISVSTRSSTAVRRAAGIVSSTGGRREHQSMHRAMGLVADIFNEKTLEQLPGATRSDTCATRRRAEAICW